MKITILRQGIFGGTDLLLDRFSLWLSSQGYDVINIEQSNEKCIDLLILPTSEMYRVWLLIKKGYHFNDVLIWSLGDGAFHSSFYNKKKIIGPLIIIKRVIDCFIRLAFLDLVQARMICFSDEVAKNTEFYNLGFNDLKLSSQQLVFPIAIKPSSLSSRIRNSDALTVGWLGRVSSDFKILALIKLIGDLNIAPNLGVCISKIVIIGDGDASDMLDSFLEKYQKEFTRAIKVERVTELEFGRLDSYLSKNIDVLFAMGTSVLDGSRSFVPSVVVMPLLSEDNSFNEGEGYRWVFESRGYSLGEFDPLHSRPQQIIKNIKQIFEDIEERGLARLASDCKAYSELFEEDRVFDKILKRRSSSFQDQSKIIFFVITLFYLFKKKIKQLRRFL